MAENNALEVQPNAQLAQFAEQNASMMQQMATAQIQSRYAIAMRFPRNVEQVRQDMIRECQRPTFCEIDPTKHGSSLAIYAVPRGNVKDENGNWTKNIIRGCTIRFAEMAARAWKNLSVDVIPIGEDPGQRIFQVNVTDFEANITSSQIVVIPKIVERISNPDNLPVLSQRTNSYGKPVYTLTATEEEISMNAQRLISKARRNLILQCIPGWLIEECTEQINTTAAKKDAEDPDKAKRRIFDAYATVGVTAEQLTEFIGHSNQLSPAEMEDLRGFFSAMREGATTWKQIVDAKAGDKAPDPTETRLAELFRLLEYTGPAERKDRAKYIGRGAELATYLKEKLAKKQNNGGRQAEEKQPAKEADTSTPGKTQKMTTSTDGGKEAATENQDAEPEPKQDTKPLPTIEDAFHGTAKPSPAVKHQAPPPDDDEY